MSRLLFAFFIMLHGLVHLWYVVLSRGLVEHQPEMGWTGRSWLFTPLLGGGPTGWLASLLYGLAALGFVAGAAGLLAGQAWWRALVGGSALLSAVLILLFWEGGLDLIVQKGLFGFLIDVAILASLYVFDWQPA